jgi:alpha-glucosidase (family GH31 glycosyl hydrolase)
MQLGAFYPFSRNHNAIGSKAQDPPSLGQEVINASRAALLARYALLPYLYTLFHDAHVTGSTVARPLFFEFPLDPVTLSIDKQFLWGSGLMISPVLTQGASNVVAYFPAGQWYDFYTGGPVSQSSNSGQNVTLPASMDYVNLHVRGGHILVLQQPNLTTTASRMSPFELTVALDENGDANGYLFWDDGQSLDTYENEKYVWINYNLSNSKVVATIVKSSYDGIASLQLDVVRVFGFSTATMPSTVKVNGQAIDNSNVDFDDTNKTMKVSKLNLPMGKDFTMEWSN